MDMKKLAIYFILIAIISACSEPSSTVGEEKLQNAVLSIRLTDAPANVDEVWIDIKQVRYHLDSDGQESWRTINNFAGGVYNLLEFTNGIDTLLFEEEMPSGKLSQIRLILGGNNRVKVEGEYFNLQTPSAQSSGLKLNVHEDIEPGVDINLWVDFDAGRSIIKNGKKSYSLKPVVRVFSEATSGAIAGTILPPDAHAYVAAYASQGDTLGTYADTISGEFLIRGMPQGSYNLLISATVGNFADSVIGPIVVSLGKAQTIDPVALMPNNPN